MLDGSAQTRSTSGSTNSPAAPNPAPCASACAGSSGAALRIARTKRRLEVPSLIISATHAGRFGVLCRLRLVFLLRRPSARHVADRACAQVHVQIGQGTVDVLVVAERRHDVLLAARLVLAPPGDDRDEAAVIQFLERGGEGRGIARANAVRPMADVTVGVIAAIAAERVPVDRSVVLELERRVAVRVEVLAILVLDGSCLLLAVV